MPQQTGAAILACIANGLSGGEIAGELHCAAGTVRNYVSAIMRKTGARSRTQMVCYACRFGVIPPRRE